MTPARFSSGLMLGLLGAAGCLATAQAVGAKRYYIEDEAAEALQRVAESIRYLKVTKL